MHRTHPQNIAHLAGNQRHKRAAFPGTAWKRRSEVLEGSAGGNFFQEVPPCIYSRGSPLPFQCLDARRPQGVRWSVEPGIIVVTVVAREAGRDAGDFSEFVLVERPCQSVGGALKLFSLGVHHGFERKVYLEA